MSDDQAKRYGLRWEIRQRLVERLRIQWDGMGDMANQQRADAAVQISTMMDEIEAWRQATHKASREIAELRKERDEARREVCEWAEHNLNEHPEHIARERGWDCYKEQA